MIDGLYCMQVKELTGAFGPLGDRTPADQRQQRLEAELGKLGDELRNMVKPKLIKDAQRFKLKL